MIDIRKIKLEKLIEVARKNRHRIVVVNRRFDAYCPTTGISFPNYDACFDVLYRILGEKELPAQERYEKTIDIIGTKYSWAKSYSSIETLVQASRFETWITIQGEQKSSYYIGEDVNRCSTSPVIWYQQLPLPHDVKPLHSPFEEVSEVWQFIAQGCRDTYEDEIPECIDSVEWITEMDIEIKKQPTN